jgi:hypothetical protein
VPEGISQAKSYFSLIESIFILSIDINATKASTVVLKDLAQAKSYSIHLYVCWSTHIDKLFLYSADVFLLYSEFFNIFSYFFLHTCIVGKIPNLL